jgi:hypothetical protein
MLVFNWFSFTTRLVIEFTSNVSTSASAHTAKAQLEEVWDMLESDPDNLSRKRLEQIRGFLQYIIQTYTSLASYLIGFHMTIDSWRPRRDKQGWRIPKSIWEGMPKAEEEWSREIVEDPEIPPLVAGDSCCTPFQGRRGNTPAIDGVQRAPSKKGQEPAQRKMVLWFWGRLGSGFGATIQIDDAIHYEYGQWCTEVTEEKSSNWQELNNLLEALERIVVEQALSGSEIFIFTDNSTAEAAFWKGISGSPLLFELVVVHLKELELEFDLTLHVVHVSGRRMINEGANGHSRADHGEGVMTGENIKKYIPLHLTPTAREPNVSTWIEDVTRDLDFQVLDESGWFDEAHSFGDFVWSVPPAAAEVVVEQLGFARLKRPSAMHMIVVPRLMTGRWRRHLTRGTDGYGAKMDDVEVWDLSSHHEPLLIFFCLPFRSEDPKQKERQDLLARIQRVLLEQEMPAISTSRRRDILRQLLREARALCPMPR